MPSCCWQHGGYHESFAAHQVQCHTSKVHPCSILGNETATTQVGSSPNVQIADLEGASAGHFGICEIQERCGHISRRLPPHSPQVSAQPSDKVRQSHL